MFNVGTSNSEHILVGAFVHRKLPKYLQIVSYSVQRSNTSSILRFIG
jgi:hypothetical protein